MDTELGRVAFQMNGNRMGHSVKVLGQLSIHLWRLGATPGTVQIPTPYHILIHPPQINPDRTMSEYKTQKSNNPGENKDVFTIWG